MRRFYLLMFMLTITIISHAQKDTLTKDGKLMIEYIDTAKGLSKDEIYSKVKAWFATTYNSAKNVVQSDDKEAGRIIGRGVMDVYLPKGAFRGEHLSNYTIDITMKDEKYRIQFYDFAFDGQYSAEVIRDMIIKKPKYQKDFGSFFTSIDYRARILRYKLKDTVVKHDDF